MVHRQAPLVAACAVACKMVSISTAQRPPFGRIFAWTASPGAARRNQLHTNSGPATGGPATGGPSTGGPATGGPATGGPATDAMAARGVAACSTVVARLPAWPGARDRPGRSRDRAWRMGKHAGLASKAADASLGLADKLRPGPARRLVTEPLVRATPLGSGLLPRRAGSRATKPIRGVPALAGTVSTRGDRWPLGPAASPAHVAACRSSNHSRGEGRVAPGCDVVARPGARWPPARMLDRGWCASGGYDGAHGR